MNLQKATTQREKIPDFLVPCSISLTVVTHAFEDHTGQKL